MTAYVTTNADGGNTVLGINPVNYEIKIDRIDVSYIEPSGGYISTFIHFYRAAVPLTGGTATPIAPLRAATPPASATATTAAVTVGPLQLMGYVYITSSSVNVTGLGGGTGSEPSGGSTSFTFPVDLTVAPGGSLQIDGLYGPSGGFHYTAAVYFEELRLSSSF